MAFKKKSPPVEPARIRPVRPNESNKVFSYYASRNTEVHDRGRMRPAESALDMRSASKQIQLQNLPMILATLVVVACIGYNFFLTTDPRAIFVGTAEERSLLRNEEVYEQAIQEELSSTLLNRSKLTFQAEKVNDALTQQFPELEAVRVSLPLMGIKPVVHIEAATPVMVLVAQDGASYVLDNSGRVISVDVGRVPQNIPIVNDRSGLEADLGLRVLPRDYISFIQRFMYQLTEQNYAIESLLLPAGVQELQIRIKDSPYITRVSLREDPVQQAGAVVATQEYLRDQGIKPKQYVDVRVGERIYYQ